MQQKVIMNFYITGLFKTCVTPYLPKKKLAEL